MGKQHKPTSIYDLIHGAEIELRRAVGDQLADSWVECSQRDGTLAAAMIVQAIDRLTHAVNRNTAAINYGNDRILEDRDLVEAESALARAQAQADAA
jgi:hypothetical protein